MAQNMGAMEALLKSMYMQQNPHLSEEEVDDKMREALHNDNIPTPRSSTSTYALTHQKFYKLLIKLMVKNKDDPQDEQDDDLQYDQDDDDLQYDQDDDDLQYDQDDNDLQYDNFQDDDSHEPQHNEYDKDRH
ncbi:serine/threonine-protein phosphatase 4 regulatory subunit 2 [Lathyrus oleraceus]|uniref:serine/threonine-protein phosphatase 4 regulatory subunit 2 n=1 Tax=Pisum sativum TaxID=3888 RepID=UPI0021CED4E4|nr:serine/threonine-protein phosphatase 4 regulatory subunit 2-like [Pisum sativum]